MNCAGVAAPAPPTPTHEIAAPAQFNPSERHSAATELPGERFGTDSPGAMVSDACGIRAIPGPRTDQPAGRPVLKFGECR